MTEDAVDRLIRVDSQLTRSFMLWIAGQLAAVIWMFFIADRGPAGKIAPSMTAAALVLLQLGFYIWYAVAAGTAAKALGDSQWKYIVWILAAPILALLPIPIVSTIIGISPISIKFLLGNQLQTAIRESASLRSM